MRRPLFRRAIRLAPVLVGATLAACAGEPFEPKATAKSPPEVRNLYSSINGSVVNIQDEFDGVGYTFDPSAKTVTHSDGRILDLADEQNVAVMNAFYGNVAADQTATDVGEVCTPENPCPEPTFAPMAEGQSGVMLRRVERSSRSHRSTANRFGIRVIGQIPQLMRRKNNGGVELMSDYNCGDLATALRDAVTQYRYNRVNFVRDGFWSAVIVWVGYKLRADLPVGGAAAAKLLGDIVLNQEKRVALTILGTLWNSNNCSSQQIRVGNYYQGGAGGGGGIPILRCHYETWQISIDGGNTWQNITVDVCEYAMN